MESRRDVNVSIYAQRYTLNSSNPVDIYCVDVRRRGGGIKWRTSMVR